MRKIDKKMKDFILDCTKKAAWNIGVSHYIVDYFYIKEPRQADYENGDTDSVSFTLASINTDKRYLKCNLKIYPKFEEKWRAGEREELKNCIHHEVAHIATQHLFDCAVSRYCEVGEMKDAWETLTEMIGRLSLKVDELQK
jgi:hypothetical protein